MRDACTPLWERPELRASAGDTLRPGGFALTDRAAEFMGLAPGWRVLDIGSGLGATVDRLRSRYGTEAWGVEPSAGQIERAPHGSALIRAGADQLPFRDGVFRAVFCECVLSLLPDREAAIQEFQRVLMPGGFLVLTDLHGEGSGASGAASCAAGAVPFSEVRGMVEACGFSVTLAEDHSGLLRDLSARLILAGARLSCERKLGYYLMIAFKGASHAGR